MTWTLPLLPDDGNMHRIQKGQLKRGERKGMIESSNPKTKLRHFPGTPSSFPVCESEIIQCLQNPKDTQVPSRVNTQSLLIVLNSALPCWFLPQEMEANIINILLHKNHWDNLICVLCNLRSKRISTWFISGQAKGKMPWLSSGVWGMIEIVTWTFQEPVLSFRKGTLPGTQCGRAIISL
jgi:hypothetical protein